MRTEVVHKHANGLDVQPDSVILNALLKGQIEALQVISEAIPEISQGAALMAGAMRGTGRLIYAAAGSSALMSNADGLELAGTFGIDPTRVRLSMAGGMPTDSNMPGSTEDNV